MIKISGKRIQKYDAILFDVFKIVQYKGADLVLIEDREHIGPLVNTSLFESIDIEWRTNYWFLECTYDRVQKMFEQYLVSDTHPGQI